MNVCIIRAGSYKNQIGSGRKGKHMNKLLKTVATTAAVLMLMGTMVWGVQMNFSSVYVDSNTYTPVVTGTKQTSIGNTQLYINNLYKADGSASSYRRVYAKATSSGTPVSAQLGSWCSLALPSAYQMAGSRVILYLMGNDPSLDCRASGYWDIY